MFFFTSSKMGIHQNKSHSDELCSRNVDGSAPEEKDPADTICAFGVTNRRRDSATARKEPAEFFVRYRDRDYDIREFLDYHPGGKKTLASLQDRVLDKELAKHPHSKSAYYLLEEFAVQHQERYNEHENLVNWDAPILWQVGNMGDRYWEWINLPVNRSIRLFRSDILEKLSVTPWYLVPIVWIPIIAYFLYLGCVTKISNNTATLQIILPSYALGIFMWTLIEYFGHQKIFHFKPSKCTSKLLITLHFLLHGNHHKAPLDRQRLVFPPSLSLMVAAAVWQIYKAVFPTSIVNFVAAGSITGYLCYDLMHYYLHNGAPKSGSYLYAMKRRHNYHHFLYHNRGFGVTSELWDRLFKTGLSLRKLNEPLEW